MPRTTIAPEHSPVRDIEIVVSDNGGNGSRGRDFGDWQYGDDDHSREHRRMGIPRSIYRFGMLVGTGSVVSLFATLTTILQFHWVHAKGRTPLDLPHVLYLNTFLILLSSLTIQLAERSLRKDLARQAVLWLLATLMLGIAFMAGQLHAWGELVARGVYVASNPASVFFYLITAAHGIHLVGGLIALIVVLLSFPALNRKRMAKTAVGVVSLYWHFLDGLWLYIVLLLLLTVQK